VEHTAQHVIPAAEESFTFTISWRKTAIALGVVAAIELVLLVVAGVALLGRSSPRAAPAPAHAAKPKAAAHPAPPPAKAKQSAPAKPKPKATPAKPKPLPPRSKLPVMVLNGNGLTGAAGTEAAVVRGRGYPVSSVGNAKRTDYGPSMVMYRPGYRDAAERLAKDVAVKIVAPLDGLKAGDLGSAKLAVVVGHS
jgi:LytR cell envelope-related transcriptional attenuator